MSEGIYLSIVCHLVLMKGFVVLFAEISKPQATLEETRDALFFAVFGCLWLVMAVYGFSLLFFSLLFRFFFHSVQDRNRVLTFMTCEGALCMDYWLGSSTQVFVCQKSIGLGR